MSSKLVTLMTVVVGVCVGCAAEPPRDVGPASAYSSTPASLAWNPCDGALADEALRAVALDPATRVVLPAGAGWWACSWTSPAQSVEMQVSQATVDPVTRTSRILDTVTGPRASGRAMRPVSESARGARYYPVANTRNVCDVVTELPQGGIIYTVTPRIGKPTTMADACAAAERIAVGLEPALPPR